MSKTVWQEVVYRCDGKKCNTACGHAHLQEETIPGKPRQADKIMKNAGWIIKQNGDCYCPTCKTEFNV